MYLVYKTSTISSSSPSVLSGLSPNNVTPLNRCDKSTDADHSSNLIMSRNSSKFGTFKNSSCMSSKTLGAWTIENMGHNSKMSFTVNKWWQLATTSYTSCSENPWQEMSSNTELHLIGLSLTSIKESVKSTLSWLEKGLVEENPLVVPLSLCLKCSNKGLLKFHTDHSYILKNSNCNRSVQALVAGCTHWLVYMPAHRHPLALTIALISSSQWL